MFYVGCVAVGERLLFQYRVENRENGPARA
jgi:hypothetical protein